jgi:hypothetical protein
VNRYVYMQSTSGEVEILIPERGFLRWQLKVRGEVVALGRGADALREEFVRQAERCDAQGLTVAAGDLRQLAFADRE